MKKFVKTLCKKYGNIILPHDTGKNESLGIAKVEDLGAEAQNIGLNIGDYVLYDYYSAYGNNDVYIITNCENIFLKLTEDEKDNYINNYVIQ